MSEDGETHSKGEGENVDCRANMEADFFQQRPYLYVEGYGTIKTPLGCDIPKSILTNGKCKGFCLHICFHVV